MDKNKQYFTNLDLYMAKYSTQAARENIIHGSSKFPLVCYTNKRSDTYSTYYNSHWQKEVEIIFVDKGSLIVMADTVPVTVESPAIVLVPSKTVHSLTLPAESEQRYLLFNPEIVRFAYYDPMQSAIFDDLYNSAKGIRVFGKEHREYIFKALKSFDYIFNNFSSKQEQVQFSVKIELLSLLSILQMAGALDEILIPTAFEKNRQKKLKDLIIWIQEHHSGPLSIADAAAKMNFSESYFCRFFKKATHMSFTEYVNDYRLSQAADEILSGAESISEIASKHGFDNESYFFRIFKKKYGVTPLNYRKK